MKVCGKCGFVNADDSNFCENCGGKLSQQNVSQQQNVSPQQENTAFQQQNVSPQQENAAFQQQNVSPQQENVAFQQQNVSPQQENVPPQYQNVMPQQSQEWQRSTQNNFRMDHVEQQREKKSNVIGIIAAVVVVAVILIVAAIIFARKPSENKGSAPEKETVQNAQPEENTSEEKEQKEGMQKEEQPESVDKEQPEADKEQPKSAESEDYSEADINAVDNAYIQVSGTIARQAGQIVLNIPQAVSVCAFDNEEQIVKKNNITDMILSSEDDLEDYIGAEVSIKGKLYADSSEKMILQVVKMDVEKEAAAQDEVFSEGHRYQLILEDATWEEAYDDCKNRGGYLVQINSEEEFQSVIKLIEDADMQSVHFYLGGRRDEDSREYYWIDTWNEFTGSMLNPEGSSWAADHWMENEPSFSSEEEQEMYMNLIYYKDNWVLNDVPIDITIYYPGKTGYICEFDE